MIIATSVSGTYKIISIVLFIDTVCLTSLKEWLRFDSTCLTCFVYMAMFWCRYWLLPLTLSSPFSCLSHSDSVSRWHDGEVWNLGHCRSGALPQFGPHVLQRRTGRHRGLRHHKRGTFMYSWLNCPYNFPNITFPMCCTEDTCPQHAVILLQLCPTSCFFYWQESFARAKNWVKELQRQASPNIVIALSGNKADLANKRAVDFQVRANKLCLYNFWIFLEILISYI